MVSFVSGWRLVVLEDNLSRAVHNPFSGLSGHLPVSYNKQESLGKGFSKFNNFSNKHKLFSNVINTLFMYIGREMKL